MKKLLIINLLTMTLASTAFLCAQQTNDFYDDAETYNLKGKTTIEVTGEISNPGRIDMTILEKRSLIIKEALIEEDSNRFVGAYRYDGYSLYDILNPFILDKKNKEEFPPIIDLFVEIEDANGNSVVLSWGEIYYPIHRNEIIIATQAARIVPSKTKDLWPLPEDVKLIVGPDLLTERNISNPVRIIIHSADISYPVNRDMSPLFSNKISVMDEMSVVGELSKVPAGITKLTYESVFYGRGRGIHSTTPFNGYLLKEILSSYFKIDKGLIKKGYIVAASIDGYRSVFTFSEIFNRNDQAEVLLIQDPRNQDGGIFRLFPSADFFSDRAVKAVSEIRLIRN
jgi:hypothetical protein